ncbi:hypothetical protein EDD86DRAFT_213302 [Gorgonomyces haynaldii]|nr:hypothetical protein EDD86DRAFT_213302 [Gorgonomyces haynaldii]
MVSDTIFDSTATLEETQSQQILEKLKRKEFDKRIYVAVIGTFESNKAFFVDKECLISHEMGDLNAHKSDVMTRTQKTYYFSTTKIDVEYWSTPEILDHYELYCRLVSSFPVAMFFFDVNVQESFDVIPEWMKRMERYTSLGSGKIKILIGTGTDTPGKRVVLTDDAQEFADTHGMKYFEVSEFDDPEDLHTVFTYALKEIKKPRAVYHTSTPRAQTLQIGHHSKRSREPSMDRPVFFEHTHKLGVPVDQNQRVNHFHSLWHSKQMSSIAATKVDWLD